MTFRFRTAEEFQPEPELTWGTFDQVDDLEQQWDWRMDAGQLDSSQSELYTAVLLSLFTDARAPDELQLEQLTGGTDRRGWWANVVDVRTDEGEVEMGSLLWTLRRSPLTEEVRRKHEDYARQSLTHLVKNEVVARMEIDAIIRPERDGIDLDIRLFSKDGSRMFDQKFGYAWRRTVGG